MLSGIHKSFPSLTQLQLFVVFKIRNFKEE